MFSSELLLIWVFQQAIASFHTSPFLELNISRVLEMRLSYAFLIHMLTYNISLAFAFNIYGRSFKNYGLVIFYCIEVHFPYAVYVESLL